MLWIDANLKKPNNKVISILCYKLIMILIYILCKLIMRLTNAIINISMYNDIYYIEAKLNLFKLKMRLTNILLIYLYIMINILLK